MLVGAVIAIVGVGVLVAGATLSAGPTGTRSDNFGPIEIGPSPSTFNQTVTGVNQTSASVVLNWTATGDVNVSLYEAVRCASAGGICPHGAPLVSWTGSTGEWTRVGGVTFPWLLIVENARTSPVTLTGSALESWPATNSPQLDWGLLIIVVGAVILLVLGGTAVFLGLFLRGGVYDRGGVEPAGENPPELYDPDFPDDDLELDDEAPVRGPNN